jgi:peptide-methionine (S)-S-oxide reductase
MATQRAVFGAWCFWCTEAVFERLKGVISVKPGYAGGTVEAPTYEQVSSGTTGHVEVADIVFDPAVISYHDLLTVFFAVHDPTSLDKQGNDEGAQYRSMIFFADESQKGAAEKFIRELDAAAPNGPHVVTRLELLTKVWPAEDYHQKYYDQHKDEPYCQIVINPKLALLQKRFSELLK